MTATLTPTEALERRQRALRAEGTPFALATLVRTEASTAAKPGAKALLSVEGDILEGFLGGGCTRAALARAAKAAIARNEPLLVALRPDAALVALGAEPCETRDGMVYERNGCASEGSLDIFVEPFVPAPDLAILGAGPVAQALRVLARGFDWRVTPEVRAEAGPAAPYIVVATQGRGDLTALDAALDTALAARPSYVAFVGSRRKAASLVARLAAKGHGPEALAGLRAPAGLEIGATTPEEIALSILAEIVAVRRGAPAGHRTNETRTEETGNDETGTNETGTEKPQTGDPRTGEPRTDETRTEVRRSAE